MAQMRDWLPRTRAARVEMARLWVDVLAPPANAGYGVDAAEYGELARLAGRADASNQAAMEGHGSRLLIAEAADDEAALVYFMRRMRHRFRSMNLTDAQVVALGLVPRDRSRTRHGEVAETVAFVMGLGGAGLQAVIRFWVSGEARRAKPPGYSGAVVIYAVLDAPPTGYAPLVNHELATRSPHTLRFDSSQRGKTVYAALCWQNRRGIRGPWSDIQAFVVP